MKHQWLDLLNTSNEIG